LSQLEEVLLDVASLSQLEAASLSLEEALSFCLLDREGAPSLFISVFFVKKQRERASCLSPSWRESSLWGRERAARRTKEAQPPDKQTKSITLHVGIEQLHVCSYAALRLNFEDHLWKLEAA
jgi:hypothetical protein